MNWFDTTILHFLNGLAHRSWTLDSWLILIQGSHFLKGGVLVILFWWAWFLGGSDSDVEERRRTLVCTIVGSIFALGVARMLAVTLPFRVRPFNNPALDLRLAYGLDPTAMIAWSSFPSDHATLFFALVTGLFLVSRRLGVIGFIWTVCTICAPRIYLGIHYPTDILGGAILGIGIVWLANRAKDKAAATKPILQWATEHSGSFYACFFALTYQIAENFDPVRVPATLVYHSLLSLTMRLQQHHFVASIILRHT